MHIWCDEIRQKVAFSHYIYRKEKWAIQKQPKEFLGDAAEPHYVVSISPSLRNLNCSLLPPPPAWKQTLRKTKEIGLFLLCQMQIDQEEIQAVWLYHRECLPGFPHLLSSLLELIEGKKTCLFLSQELPLPILWSPPPLPTLLIQLLVCSYISWTASFPPPISLLSPPSHPSNSLMQPAFLLVSITKLEVANG